MKQLLPFFLLPTVCLALGAYYYFQGQNDDDTVAIPEVGQHLEIEQDNEALSSEDPAETSMSLEEDTSPSAAPAADTDSVEWNTPSQEEVGKKNNQSI